MADSNDLANKSVGGNVETPKSLEARRRKRELERELMELKMKIAKVEEKKKQIGGHQDLENSGAEERRQGQPGSDGTSDPEPPAKKSRPLAPAFKPRLMLTKTSGAGRVWSTASRASPGPSSDDVMDRSAGSNAAAPSGAPLPSVVLPRPDSAEPHASQVYTPGSTAGTRLSREVSPFSEGAAEAGEEGEGQGAAKRRRYPPTKGTEVGRPSWLPEGWRVEEKVRGQGATAGTKDKYYFSPEGKRFRSRAEIQRFIESGALPAAPKKKKDGDASAPNSRPGTPGAAPLANRPFDATPEDIQRLLSGAAAGPASQPVVPKIPNRKTSIGTDSYAGNIAPLLPALDPRQGSIPQGFPGQWPVAPGLRNEVPLWQQPLVFPPGVIPPFRGQHMWQSHLGPQHPGLDLLGRAGSHPLRQGPDPGQAYGGPELFDFKRAPPKQKVKKVKAPRKRLLVADRFHLESLGKRLVKERLASLLQEGIRQRQGGRGNQGDQGGPERGLEPSGL